MAFVVIYDACALHDAPLRDFLLRAARKRSLNLRAHWTRAIEEEVVRSVCERRHLTAEQVARLRQLLSAQLPDGLVENYEGLIPSVTLPDADDAHVVAAAIRCGAQVIVTFNTAHFPSAALEIWDIEAQPPDEFLTSLYDLDPAAMHQAYDEVPMTRKDLHWLVNEFRSLPTIAQRLGVR